MMTRRLILCCLFAVLTAFRASAGPARPGVHLYRQPDGSTMSIVIHGDEFHHWATDPSGNLLELDSNGYYRKAKSGIRPTSLTPRKKPTHAPSKRSYMTTGERHIPVLLIEFADVFFSFDDVSERFDRMLNREGYSDNGATGSVRDFYVENSHGLFTPVFDVYEPVRLDKNMAVYGGNVGDQDKAPEMALYEACLLLDETLDFSAYDADEDDTIDMILFYFAGYDEAEHGPADAIWSHQWDIREDINENSVVKKARFDGKALGRYFCTSELTGSSGTVMRGIGSTCHEFSHSLGLPDFYDSDYTDNGLAGGMYDFSTMSYGLYNNDGRTPPYFNILERAMLGWVEEDDIPILGEGDILWDPVQENKAYIVPSGTEGEFFIWEYRNATGWDSPLPAGLLLYHIDRSGNIVLDGNPASFYWENWETNNILNAYRSHPLAYIIPSAAPSSMNYMGKMENIVFPGKLGVVCSDPVDWSGSGTDYQTVDISLTQEGARAYILNGYNANVSGRVTSQEGVPVSGAVVKIDISETIGVTGLDGRFVLDLAEQESDTPFVLTITGEGYRKTQAEGILNWRSAYIPVSLMKAGESSVSVLQKYDPSQSKIFYPLPSSDFGDCMGAVRFTSEELFRYVGRRITAVSFSTYGSKPAQAVYVIIDIDGKRVLTREVEEPVYGVTLVNEVDISDADIRIPDGADIYIGYGIKGSEQPYPLGVTMQGHPENSYYAKLNLERSSWAPMTSDRVTSGYMDLLLSADVKESTDVSNIADMGYAFIDLGIKTWKAGETLPLKVSQGPFEPVGTTWLFDGEITFDTEVILTKGVHTIQALLDYGEGRSENLKAVITCE